jgi:hypothetical protein
LGKVGRDELDVEEVEYEAETKLWGFSTKENIFLSKGL